MRYIGENGEVVCIVEWKSEKIPEESSESVDPARNSAFGGRLGPRKPLISVRTPP